MMPNWDIFIILDLGIWRFSTSHDQWLSVSQQMGDPLQRPLG